MSIDAVLLRSSISKEEARYVLAYNPLEPLARSTIDQMIASGELEEPKRKGRFKVWSKKYISEKENIAVDDINKIIIEVEKMKAT